MCGAWADQHEVPRPHHERRNRPGSSSSVCYSLLAPCKGRNSADVSHLSLTHRALPRPWLALDVDSARDIGQHTHRYPSEPLRRRLRHGQRLSPVPKGEPHRGYVPEVRETSGPLVDPRCTLIHVVPAWGTLPLSLAPSCRSQQVGAVRKSCGNRWERLVSAGHGLGRERTVNPSRKLPRFESLTCHHVRRAPEVGVCRPGAFFVGARRGRTTRAGGPGTSCEPAWRG